MLKSMMTAAVLVGLGGVSMAAAGAEQKAAPPPRAHKIRVLLVTGGHNFQHEPFLDVFKSQPDLEVCEVEQPAAQEWFAPDKADQYDVMVWYDLWRETPETTQKNLTALLEKGKPLVVLHHAIATYQRWPDSIKIVGGKYFVAKAEGRPRSVAKDHQTLNIKLAPHPITRFTKDFTIADGETYKGVEILPEVKPLLTVDNPENDKVCGWVYAYGKSPVVYIQPGHGPSAYENPGYRRLVAQAIRWVAGQLPEESEEGFVPLFNGKDLTGWHVVGKPEAYQVVEGVLRSESGRDGHWLRTEKQYSDFILRLEWRVGKDGNAGVFVRSAAEGLPWVTGHEIQITNEPRELMHCTGTLYGRVAVDPRPDESPDVWHAFEIQCRGPLIRVYADQVPVVDVDQRTVPAMKELPLGGYIGLQDSHNPKGYIEYRNIRIKELKAQEVNATTKGS